MSGTPILLVLTLLRLLVLLFLLRRPGSGDGGHLRLILRRESWLSLVQAGVGGGGDHSDGDLLGRVEDVVGSCEDRLVSGG